MLELRFLGQFSLLQDGRPVKLSRGLRSRCWHIFACTPAPAFAAKLAGLLWPEASETSARNNLRQALWRIRKALEEGGAGSQDCLLADDLAIAFDARTPYWLDVEALTRPLPSSPTPADLTPLVAVYGGELLPGFYDEWTMLERERAGRLRATHGATVGLLVAGRDWTQTAAWAERWIALGSTPEAAYRSLMIAHAALGDLAAMNAAYQRCVDALWRDLGVEPSEQTTALVEQLRNPQTRAVLLPGGRLAEVIAPDSAFSAIPDEAPYPGEPPFKGLHYFAQEDSELFFGRERLVVELTDRLHAGQPFLAVVGASGSGKSSLVRAGLAPALTARAAPLRWRAVILTPTAHPLQALAAAVAGEGKLRRWPARWNANPTRCALCWAARRRQPASAGSSSSTSSRALHPLPQRRRAARLCRRAVGRGRASAQRAGQPGDCAASRLLRPVRTTPGAAAGPGQPASLHRPHERRGTTPRHRGPGATRRMAVRARPGRPDPARRWRGAGHVAVAFPCPAGNLAAPPRPGAHPASLRRSGESTTPLPALPRRSTTTGSHPSNSR
ncbi:MAG: hypothetical protein HZY76_12430 [Anaerolineae bacterium]|nr:MAG: hypothetical protein HZY76_12430 [Anaerolineae bacterium]